MSSFAKNTPIITVASSGALEPAAMKVAPATSGDNFSSKNRKKCGFFLSQVFLERLVLHTFTKSI